MRRRASASARRPTRRTRKGVGLSDPALRVVFFALHHDQKVNTPISAFARDPAGTKRRRSSSIARLPRRSCSRAFHRPGFSRSRRARHRVEHAGPDRRHQHTRGAPQGVSDDQRGAAPAQCRDHRQGRVRHQAPDALERGVRAAWQLAGRVPLRRSTDVFLREQGDRSAGAPGLRPRVRQQAPVLAANNGIVVFAEFLGIYGNCIILDHGLGVQTLYAHLSTFTVKPGDVCAVTGAGRTGITVSPAATTCTSACCCRACP